ncbi:MAG: hypothetical protein HHJ15_18210 [Rhodoferax sp.]|uniref:hypothetical protein n=1 Tax=Rhodoferax sp. TaxID=50421 RepID=UPI0017929650|nr:hypothetical protein [Rhodoferax sp.]NMM21857.1 hypothetical protein [Rhodoferax sp.]
MWFSKWSVHRASQGINMLGYRIWPTHKLLRRLAIVMFRRDIRRLRKKIDVGEATLTDVTSRVKSFTAHAKHADTWRLRNELYQVFKTTNGDLN